jgi:hypothetical protein
MRNENRKRVGKMLNVRLRISHSFLLLLIITLYCKAQTKEYIAIIPPFHSSEKIGGEENPIQLQSQLFVVFVYSNAAAVYSESEFINQSDNILEQEFSLPSAGHNENGNESDGRISNGIFSIQFWIEGEHVEPQFIRDGDEQWYTVKTEFKPNETREVNALFWAETSLSDIDSLPGFDTTKIFSGKRGFLIDLAHATAWNGVIQSVDVYVILKDSISAGDESFSADPPNYELNDATLIWSMEDIEPSADDNIEISYESSGNFDGSRDTMAKLSAFIVKKVYDQLLDYVNQLEE